MFKSVACSILVAAAACSTPAAPEQQPQQQQQAQPQSPPRDENQLAVRATPAVVKVWAGWSGEVESPDLGLQWPISPASGSGFFISADGYVVTNAHVVSRVQQSESEWRKNLYQRAVEKVSSLPQVRAMSPDKRQAVLNNLRLNRPQRVTKIQLPDGRHLPYHIAKAERPDAFTGKDIAILKVVIENAPTLPLGDSASVKLEDRLYAIGFPGAAEFSRVEGYGSQHTDTNPIVASFTDGKVASVDQRATSGTPIIQVTIPIAHGNSGGPVINQAGEVVGLATWGAVEGNTNVAGFNFLVTINAVKEEIRAAGALTSRSETDRLFALALEAYNAGRYKEAVEKFEDVKELYPAMPGISRMVADARRQVREGNAGPTTSSSSAAGISTSGGGGAGDGVAGVVIALFVCGAIVGVLFVSVRRFKGGTAVAPVPMPAPVGGNPPVVAKTVAFSRDMLSQIPCGSLMCVQGALIGRSFDIVAGGLAIGRDPRAHISLPDVRVSALHARFDVQPGRVRVLDAGSTNGTFVNGVRVDHNTPRDLVEGDLVSFAEPAVATFMFRRSATLPAQPARTTLTGAVGGARCN